MIEPILDESVNPEAIAKPNASTRLDALVVSDQQFRSLGTKESQPNPEIDRKNREEVQEMIDAGEITSAENLIKASLIFQHGESLEDFSKAFNLSARAVELGKAPFVTILAQAFDRYMVYKQQKEGISQENIKQRYGTQAFVQDGITKYYSLDGLANPDEKEMFEPLLEGFSSKTKEEQQEITSRIYNKWQEMSIEERQRILDSITSQFSKL
ncbi:MAG: hypothetical protein COU25_03605 [Candidatus Levybacteria bacterium CG10_big_fil_rev_8_21_14_0_10_35_13]|nr:MAG: hypothetical protein COU25_03605 [Candidatus Levybacteria bacterium CG10_big_fil_rev_8_21_14_0_10_35_13]